MHGVGVEVVTLDIEAAFSHLGWTRWSDEAIIQSGWGEGVVVELTQLRPVVRTNDYRRDIGPTDDSHAP